MAIMHALPDHWNEQSERYLSYADEVGFGRLARVVFGLPFFGVGIGCLGVALLRVVPAFFEEPPPITSWWAGVFVLLLSFAVGCGFVWAGLATMFHREGVIFDRISRTGLEWSRFLGACRIDQFSLEGYQRVTCEPGQAGMFARPYLLQLAGEKVPVKRIGVAKSSWDETQKRAAEVSRILSS